MMALRTARLLARAAPKALALRPQALTLAGPRACGLVRGPNGWGLGAPLGRWLCTADSAPVSNAVILSADEVEQILTLEKGRDIFVLDLRGMHGGRLGETLVIVTGANRRHLVHLAETVRAAARGAAPGGAVPSIEDEHSEDWMLLDLGSVVVHFMSEHGRSYYDLDSLWTANVAKHVEAQLEASRASESKRTVT